MLKAAKHSHGNVDTSKIKYLPAKYTKKQVDDSIDAIMNATKALDASHLEVYSASAAPDGSGIQLVVAKSAVDHIKAEFADNSVPVTVTTGDPITPIAWRWDDPSPFIGRDVLVGPAHAAGYTAQCTAGLAAEDSSGSDYIITADHCFSTGSGTHVHGEGDAVGNWQLNYGSYVGDVGGDRPEWDAQVIWTKQSNGAGSNSDEADQPQGQWYPVTSAAYSYNGDSVCQDRARSYYDGSASPTAAAGRPAASRPRWEEAPSAGRRPPTSSTPGTCT
ncbi:hypothetical protein ABTY61_41035 [Kitasatospora sp. NPDC096128]|uniref:hypothetical protein n=1 Tax=Kitasatospora sp. NPDC096128 TaxID=3155547 RepID=UPI00331DBC38